MNATMVNSLTAMTNEELLRNVPAIGAEAPAGRVSGIYKQVRTLDVADILRSQGWMPVKARSLRVRSADRQMTRKHEIRFSRIGDKMMEVGDSLVQLVLTNSHDASSAYKVMLGIFRLACSNGMVVSTGTFSSISIRHVGFDPQEVVDASARVGEGGMNVMNHIGAMEAMRLDHHEQVALGKAAINLLFSPEEVSDASVVMPPERLLQTRRSSDNGDSLWKTFNRIQENVTKGGIRYHRRDNENGMYSMAHGDDRYRRASIRPIKSIDKDIKLNQSLWALAEEMLSLKQGNAPSVTSNPMKV